MAGLVAKMSKAIAGKSRAAMKRHRRAVARRIRIWAARYDAAVTSDENRRHWLGADGRSPDASASPHIRRILRNRCRYEVANNPYAKGIVATLANYVIGTGPRLQMLTDNPAVNNLVEKEFARWAKAVHLPQKLRKMRMALCDSGEVFALLITNPRVRHPVKLDIRIIEADRVCDPLIFSRQLDNGHLVYDGIEYDEYGNPVVYRVLKHHPGGELVSGVGYEYDEYPAEAVIHLMRADRPEQKRGVPELVPSLEVFARLRRYGLATLSAAEQAALASGVIYTDGPADEENTEVEPMDSVPMERGEWMTMPYGWKISQIKAEQPTTVYGDFKREQLNEAARPVGMPFNLAAANSSNYNYASGRLDHQAFFKSVSIDQMDLGTIVLDPILDAWISEAALVEGLLPQAARMRDVELPHQWFWDGVEHVDPLKEANAQGVRLSNHTTTLAAEYAKAGRDWETELRQRAKERKLMNELGLKDEDFLQVPEEKEETVDVA